MRKYPRVLIVSHNALSRVQNNGKTLEAFFGDWDKAALAQIYLQPEEPDLEFTSNYFCMSDYEVLNAFLSGGGIGRKVTEAGDRSDENLTGATRALYAEKKRSRQNRRGLNAFIHNRFVARDPLFVYVREALWRRAKWDTEALNAFISDFAPDALFFQGSSCAFAYDIVKTLTDRYSLPLILELTDDYTYYQCRLSPFDRLNKARYLAVFSRAIGEAHKVIAISDKMKSEYSQRFGGNYEVLLNSVDATATLPKAHLGLSPEAQTELLYAGNVSINRHKTLIAIGEALSLLNSWGGNFKLNVFTPAPPESNILAALCAVPTIAYGGSLSPDELRAKMERSDVLVHAESFDERMKKVTRLSVSTKIPEYLSANRLILAVGPEDIASMSYLRDNGAAATVFSPEALDIAEALVGALAGAAYDEILSNATALYNKNHRAETTRERIYAIITEAVEQYGR